MSFRFITIPILWVYHHYNWFIYFSARIDFRRQDSEVYCRRAFYRRQIMTSEVDPRVERVTSRVKYKPDHLLDYLTVCNGIINHLKSNAHIDHTRSKSASWTCLSVYIRIGCFSRSYI